MAEFQKRKDTKMKTGKILMMTAALVLTGALISASASYAHAGETGFTIEEDIEQADAQALVEVTGNEITDGIEGSSEEISEDTSEENLYSDTTEDEKDLNAVNNAASNDSDKRSVLDLSDDVIQFGGFPKEKKNTGMGAGATGSDDAGIGERIAKAINGFEEYVDLSDGRLSREMVKDELADVINHNPGFFYVAGASVSYQDQGDDIAQVRFEYMDDASRRSSKYDKEVSKIISGLDHSWPVEKQLMYLHDYLVTHCQYDLSYSRYSAYDAIVEHSAVCMGYALAYMDLVNKADIPDVKAYYVSSECLDHGWNIIRIGKDKFFVDCTWDDPITSGPSGEGAHFYRMHCEHKDFLGSQTKMIEMNHTTTDWYCDGEYVYGKYDNPKYDDASWRESYYSAAVYPEGDTIVYINDDPVGKAKGISEYDLSKNRNRLLSDFSCEKYYGQSLVLFNGKIYANNDTTIYTLDPASGDLKFYYSLSSKELEKGTICGMEAEGSRIRYDLGTGYSSAEYTGSAYLKISTANVTSISLDKDYIPFANAGDVEVLTATLVPANADKVFWASLDPAVATVANGKVTAVGTGKTTIIARAGDKVAECYVTVGRAIQIDRRSADLLVGQTLTLTARYVNFEPSWYNSIEWESDDPSIVSVEDGVIKGLKAGTTKVYAYDLISNIWANCLVTVSDLTPGKPVISGISNDANGLTLSWAGDKGVTGYNIYRKAGSGKFSLIANVAGNTYTDTGAKKNGTKYSYKISGYNILNGTTYKGKAAVCATYRLTPSVISKAKNGSKGTVTLKYKKAKGSAYEIEYSYKKDFGNSKTIRVNSKKAGTGTIKGLKKGKTCYIRLRPYKKVKKKTYYGSWSDVKRVKIKK